MKSGGRERERERLNERKRERERERNLFVKVFLWQKIINVPDVAVCNSMMYHLLPHFLCRVFCKEFGKNVQICLTRISHR